MGGRKGTRRWWSGRVTEPSSNCQQGGLFPGTGLECGEALLGAESMQLDSALWESLWQLPGPLFQEAPGSIQGPGNWHRRECSGARWLGCYFTSAVTTQELHTPSLDLWFLLQKLKRSDKVTPEEPDHLESLWFCRTSTNGSPELQFQSRAAHRTPCPPLPHPSPLKVHTRPHRSDSPLFSTKWRTVRLQHLWTEMQKKPSPSIAFSWSIRLSGPQPFHPFSSMK